MDVIVLDHQPKNYDVILGMDLLADFHLTIYQNNFIMSN